MKPFPQNNQAKFWLGIVVTIGCLVGTFFFIDPAQIWQALSQAKSAYVFGTAVLIAIYMGLRAVRWHYLLGNRGPLITIFHMQNIGAMLTQLLPFRMGDVTRAVLVGQKPHTTVPQAISTVIVERVLDMIVVVLLFPLMLTQIDSLPTWLERGAAISTWLAGLAVIVMITAVRLKTHTIGMLTHILERIPKLNATILLDRFEDLLAGFAVFSRWNSTGKVLMLSFLTWLPIFAAYHTMMTAVHIDNHTLNMAIFIACAGALSVAAPSSPGQIGVFHVGVIAAATALGQIAETAAALAFLYHATNFIVMVSLGFVGVLATNLNVKMIFANRNRLLNRQKVPVN